MSWGPSNATLQSVFAAYPDLARKFPASQADLAQLYMPDAELVTANRKKAVDYWNRHVKQ
jgi:hypothetical protein